MKNLRKTLSLAFRQAELMQEADDAEMQGGDASDRNKLGLGAEAEEVLRMAFLGKLRGKDKATDARLHKIVVFLPGDALLEERGTYFRGSPDPRSREEEHPFIVGDSWDPAGGTFTVAMPCEPAMSQRWGRDDGIVEVLEILLADGLTDGPLGTPVVDHTDGAEEFVGTVRGVEVHVDRVEFHVRLTTETYAVRTALDADRVHLTGVAYQVLQESVMPRPGKPALIDVLRWKVCEIRLRLATQTEAAPLKQTQCLIRNGS